MACDCRLERVLFLLMSILFIKQIKLSLRLLLPGLGNNTIDVGIDVLVGGVEVADDDADDLCSPETCRGAEAFLYVLYLGSNALGELVGNDPVLVFHLE